MATFGIDVDEVLRSLCSEMVRLYNREFNDCIEMDSLKDFDVDVSFPRIKKTTGESASKWFFQEHGHELFYDSPALINAPEAVKKLREIGHQVYIISYQKSLANKLDTLRWLQKYEIEYDGICFVKDKTIVHLDYLIDDNDWNFIRCNCKHGVLITAPYNKHIGLDLLKNVSNCDTVERADSLMEFVNSLKDRVETCEKYQKK